MVGIAAGLLVAVAGLAIANATFLDDESRTISSINAGGQSPNSESRKGYDWQVYEDDDNVRDYDDAQEQQALSERASIGRDAAEDAALAETGGGRVVFSELDEDDGFVFWDVYVRLGDGRIIEVTVDAGNGRVLQLDQED